MPSTYTSSQKAAISQFVGFTSVKDSVAAKQLKSHNWNIEQAVDAGNHAVQKSKIFKQHKAEHDADLEMTRWFHQNGAVPATQKSDQTLHKQFDKYRENAAEEPDKIGVEGSMKYLGDLGVKLDEVAVLAVLTELGAPTMGEFTREGFVNGWSNHRADTLSKQQSQITSFRHSLTSHPSFFKRTYKSTFLLARAPGQKILPLDTALDYWRLLFSPPSLSWNTPTTPWLDWWIEYLESRWKKSISKDTWDQTGNFVMKCLEDEGMGWWSEDGAWPGVLDEFVGFVREKRGSGGGGTEEEMEVEG
ncbi:Scaffold-type E3 ligase [Lecanora helva]